MPKILDLDQSAELFRKHITRQAASYSSQPVQLTVIDGSGQFLYGYVWCTYGDRTVQCIAYGPTDLTGVTPSNNAVIWALPPNPNAPNEPYFMLGVALAPGSGVNRYPPIIASHVTSNDGQLLLAWLEM